MVFNGYRNFTYTIHSASYFYEIMLLKKQKMANEGHVHEHPRSYPASVLTYFQHPTLPYFKTYSFINIYCVYLFTKLHMA